MGNRDRLFLKPPVLTSRDSQANLASRNGHQDGLDEDPVEEHNHEVHKPHSLWWLFYDCIAKFPKFEQLKNFINESHRLKEF
jgi:hypothetical protein